MQRVRYIYLLKVVVLIGSLAGAIVVSRKRRVIRAGVGVFFFLGAVGAAAEVRIPRYGDALWKSFFSFLDSARPTKAAAMVFSVAPPNVMELSGFVGVDFYLSPEIRSGVFVPSAWQKIGERSQASAIYSLLLRGEEPDELLLFDLNLKGSRRMDSYRLSNVTETRVLQPEFEFSPLVLRIRNRDGLERTFERLLTELEAQEKNEALKFRIFLGLAGLRAFQGRCAEAADYWNRARNAQGDTKRLHDPERELRLIERCKQKKN